MKKPQSIKNIEHYSNNINKSNLLRNNLYSWPTWFGIFRCPNWLMKSMYGRLYIPGLGNDFGGFPNKKKYTKVIVCKI